jgi:hypothetical protein
MTDSMKRRGVLSFRGKKGEMDEEEKICHDLLKFADIYAVKDLLRSYERF